MGKQRSTARNPAWNFVVPARGRDRLPLVSSCGPPGVTGIIAHSFLCIPSPDCRRVETAAMAWLESPDEDRDMSV